MRKLCLTFLVHTWPLWGVSAVGLVVWRFTVEGVHGPEGMASVIVLLVAMSGIGAAGQMIGDHLDDDKHDRGLLLSAIDRLSRDHHSTSEGGLRRVK